MVIYESMRLYPPEPLVARLALEDFRFGDPHVPKGINIWILLLYPEIWGPDVQQFKPERFANGVGGSCKHSHVFMLLGGGALILTTFCRG